MEISSSARRVAPHPPPERILLLALLPIGDTLFTTPTVRALRDRYPQARLTALVYRRTAALMRCVPGIDDVIVLPFGPDWAGLPALVRTLRTLHARHFDVAIDFTSPAYKAISLLGGIPIRTYLKPDALFWLLPGSHRRWRTTHATEHYYDAARELDLPPWRDVCHTLVLDLPPNAHAQAALLLQQYGVRPGHGRLVGLHAGGRWLEGRKQWPAAHFANLARRLHEHMDARIMLLGGPEEGELAQIIAAGAGGDPIVAAGAVPLLTSLALIARCDLFVGNDSALLHSAAALGTPYVGLFGPTCPANYAPVGRRSGQGTVVLPPWPCRCPQYFVGGSPLWRRSCCAGTCAALQNLDVETVLAQAITVLTRSRPMCPAPMTAVACCAPAPAGPGIPALPLPA